MHDVEFRLDVFESQSEWIVACECPQGRQSVRIPVPFEGEDLRSRLSAVEMALVRSSSPVTTRRGPRTELTFGRELSKILLPGDIRVLFALCRQEARAHHTSMRVLINPIGPNVCRVPWEFATDPDADDDYLALRLSMARSPHLMERVAPLTTELPLRVLGVISRPRELAQLEADHERDSITHALASLSSELVHTEWTDSDRWQTLRAKLQSEPWHILHFIGHGGFDEESQSGYLELTDDDGSALRVQAADLAGFIRDNPQLKLVVLNACESAATGHDGVFSSTAAKLMRAGVPAVVAMQYEITDPAALAFSLAFYEAIARGVAVDHAVRIAREQVKICRGSLEWATPVLFLASPETRIFTIPGPATDAEAGPGRQADWQRDLTGKLDDLARATEHEVPPTSPAPRVGRAGDAAATTSVGTSLERRWASPAYGACTWFDLGPRSLAALACGPEIRVMSLMSRTEAAHCALARSPHVVQLAWSPWARHLASLDAGGTALVWDLSTETPVQTLRVARTRAVHLAFSHHGRFLALACEDLTIHVFDTNGSEVRAFSLGRRPGQPDWQSPLRRISSLAFTADDRGLVVGGDDGAVRWYDVRGRQVRVWQHTRPVTASAVAGDRVLTSCADGRIRLWDWEAHLLHRMDGGPGQRAAFSEFGDALVVTAGPRCLVWGVDGRRLGVAALALPGAGAGFRSREELVTVDTGGTIESWVVPTEGTNP